jgi:hypothetical protein
LRQTSDTEVKGKINALIMKQHLDESVPRLSGFGTFDLVFTKTGDGWKIKEFHVHLQIPGPTNR